MLIFGRLFRFSKRVQLSIMTTLSKKASSKQTDSCSVNSDKLAELGKLAVTEAMKEAIP